MNDMKNMPVDKKAKLDVLKALRQVAMDLIKEKSEEGSEEGEMPGMPGHMQKVSVMAKDPEHLMKGLEMAKKVLPEVEESEMEDPEHESMESPEHESMEDMSGNESDDEEAMLMKKLEELRSKKKMLK